MLNGELLMKKLSLLLVLCSVLALCSCAQKEDKNVLHVYNWSDYIDPSIVEQFEKKYNCKLIFDYYDSNEAMFAKLKAGCSGYDVIFPSSYMADIMYAQDMLMKFDKSRLPDLKNLDEKYVIKTKDKNSDYSVLYVVSFSGIGYNSLKVKEIKHSWGMFGDVNLRDRMTMFDDMREAIGAALKYLGYSLNTTDDNQLKQAKHQMLEWKKNLAAYQVDEAKTSLGAGILLLIQMYNGDAYLIEQDSPFVKFFVPEEGTSIGPDTIVIPKSAKNLDLAYKFVNFLCEPENAAKNMEYLGYICPIKAAYPLIDKELYKKFTIPDDIFAKSEVIQDLGDYNKKYVELWDEIKAENL